MTFRHMFLLAVVIGGGASGRADAPYVVLDSGRQVTGTSATADEDGRILLRTETGVLTFDKGTRVVTERPRGLDQAIQHMQQQQFAKAVVLLEQVARENRHLGWDREALKLLARAHSSLSRAAEAVVVYEQLFALDPQARNEAEDFLRYLKGLEASGAKDKLGGMLDSVVRTAPRAVAAWAHLKRGRQALDQGDARAALLDFKCAADFFPDQKDTLPEAYYLTARCFHTLRDPLALVYSQKLKTEFPSSPYAGKSLEP